MKAVNQYTLDGKYIKTYNTVAEIAKTFNVNPCVIYTTLNRKNKYKPITYKGYIIKYADKDNGGNDMLEFNLKNGKKVSFTEKEAEQATKLYRTMLSMLDELEKNPRMIPTMKQAMYEAIREIDNAKSETKEENTEEKNPNETEWKPFMAEN